MSDSEYDKRVIGAIAFIVIIALVAIFGVYPYYLSLIHI